MGIAIKRLGLWLALLAAACGGTQPPPETSATPADYVAADADFMRNMIGHHAQAIEMATLARDNTATDGILLLARRIEESQVFEIGLMQRWLEARDEPAEAPHDMGGMAGMATPEQMAALAETKQTGFDRLFLELMIAHHEGALVMLGTLNEAEGGGLGLEIFTLISHIDGDQRAEIARMQRMLNELQ